MLGAALAPGAVGAAVVDTLEDLAGAGELVPTRTIDGVAVTIRNGFGEVLQGLTYGVAPASFSGAGNGINAPANPTGLGDRFLGRVGTPFETGGGLTFSFDMAIVSFGLTTLDLLEDASPDGATVTLTVFDVGNNVVDSQSRTESGGNRGGTGNVLVWNVGGAGIVKASLTAAGLGVAEGYGIDNISVMNTSQVPLPGALWLLGPALALLGANRLRRRRRA